VRIRVSVARNRMQMLGRRVPLVSVEAVPWISAVQFRHLAVTNDFRDDRGCGNRRAAAVSLRHAALNHRDIRHAKRVDEYDVRNGDQGEDGPLHRAQRGLVDVDAIDLSGVGRGDPPGDRGTEDFLEETLALGSRRQLGVADAGDVAVGVKHDGRRDHRAREATAAHFIDTRNVREPAATQRILEGAKSSDAGHSCSDADQFRVLRSGF
jgi:hypothetical protein